MLLLLARQCMRGTCCRSRPQHARWCCQPARAAAAAAGGGDEHVPQPLLHCSRCCVSRRACLLARLRLHDWLRADPQGHCASSSSSTCCASNRSRREPTAAASHLRSAAAPRSPAPAPSRRAAGGARSRLGACTRTSEGQGGAAWHWECGHSQKLKSCRAAGGVRCNTALFHLWLPAAAGPALLFPSRFLRPDLHSRCPRAAVLAPGQTRAACCWPLRR